MVPTTTTPFHGLWKKTTGAAIGLLIGAAAFTTNIGTTSAAVITDGCIDVNVFCTLQELVDGGTITVGDKLFSDWEAFGDPEFDDIDIYGIDDGGDIGISFIPFDDALTAIGDEIELDISFVVTPDTGWKIKDNTLELVEYFVDDILDFVEIFEEVLADPFGTNELIGEKLVDSDNPPGSLFDSADFDPQSQIGVNLYLLVDGLESEAGIIQFDLRFSQMQMAVPEPGAVAMFAIGLAGLGFVRRRRKN